MNGTHVLAFALGWFGSVLYLRLIAWQERRQRDMEWDR